MQQWLINNSSQLNMFQEIILPIFRSTRLCYSLSYNAPTMLPARGRQHHGSASRPGRSLLPGKIRYQL